MVDVEPASPAPAASPSASPTDGIPPATPGGDPVAAPGGDTPATAPGGDTPATAPGGVAQQEGDAVEAAGGPSPRLSAREGRSTRDMVLSLAVLIVPIALLVIFYRTVLSGDAPVTVDPSSTIQEAQQAKLFPVAVPAGLGTDWYASSATFTKQSGGASLRIGYVDPDKDPVLLIESSIPPTTLLPTELTTNAKPLSTFRAANGVWRLFDGRPGEQALVLADENRTIIVVGKTGVQNLEQLASSLRG